MSIAVPLRKQKTDWRMEPLIRASIPRENRVEGSKRNGSEKIGIIPSWLTTLPDDEVDDDDDDDDDDDAIDDLERRRRRH